MWFKITGWISASTLTLIFFGLRWLEWFFWACDFYAVISILSLLIRAGVNVHNPYAMWIENHSPKLVRQLGMLMSQTVPVRFLFWATLLVIGYQLRDWQAYGQFTERRPANWLIVREYPSLHYPGMAYDIELADGSMVTEFVPCEDVGLTVGLRVSRAGFYKRENCVSFRGPRAYIVKESVQGMAAGKH